MMMIIYYMLYATSIVSLHQTDVMARGYCSFPYYLWRPLHSNTQRQWLTHTEYLRNYAVWKRQTLITASETEMLVQEKMVQPCVSRDYDSGGSATCERTQRVMRVVCLQDEPDGASRVQIIHSDTGETEFGCIRFELRNANVVQVFEATPKAENEDKLCHHGSLRRQIWPWLASIQQEYYPCPLIGGFDFRTYVNDGSKLLCPDMWRPSRLESECIYGEGIQLMFPEKACNPFALPKKVEPLQCWASWTETDSHNNAFQFIILGKPGKPPQYALRLSDGYRMSSEQDVHLYFSPITPINEAGEAPPGRVTRVTLKMSRSDPSLCYDESPECVRFAKEGKCTNSAREAYANYCKRSCDQCNFGDSNSRALPDPPQPECYFPDEFQGSWVMYGNQRRQTLHIKNGALTSHLGHFICKTKHWSKDEYKLMTYFTNGCRQRYVCAELTHGEGNTVEYRISKSTLNDRPINTCSFKPDPLPLNDTVRSSHMKLLLPHKSLSPLVCGLNGNLPVSVDFPGGGKCVGTLTDWNPVSCISMDTLVLGFHNCPYQNTTSFECVSHLSVTDTRSILITRDSSGPHPSKYTCWMITKSGPSSSGRDNWIVGIQAKPAHCVDIGLNMDSSNNALLTIRAQADSVETKCGETITMYTGHSLTGDTSRRKNNQHPSKNKMIRSDQTAYNFIGSNSLSVHKHDFTVSLYKISILLVVHCFILDYSIR